MAAVEAAEAVEAEPEEEKKEEEEVEFQEIGLVRQFTVTTVTSLALGVKTSGDRMDKIIGRCTPLPFTESKDY